MAGGRTSYRIPASLLWDSFLSLLLIKHLREARCSLPMLARGPFRGLYHEILEMSIPWMSYLPICSHNALLHRITAIVYNDRMPIAMSH